MSDDCYNPGDIGIHNGNYFGFPWNPEECSVVIVNVPWDATTSYKRGTAKGPEAMIAASTQLDFYPFDNPGSDIVRCGTDNTLHEEVNALNDSTGMISKRIISLLEQGVDQDDPAITSELSLVNEASAKLEQMVYQRCKQWLGKGKRVIIAGGEHSVPFGYLKALADEEGDFGILQIDAHADLRNAYEGFGQSHASIMHNALGIEKIIKIVQVGIRDLSTAEMDLALGENRINMYSDHNIKNHIYAGGSWFEKCREMISVLPQKVYISFDIDGLEPQYCPNTGTPVPGGLTPDEAIYLVRMLAESGRTIIGCDLCEVAPGTDEWDANTGSRILYRLAVLMQHSNYPTEA